nr:retrovirus-related Pol polyprotein from transposon TNT 1-94 [Tanacetum cinerariifolium]
MRMRESASWVRGHRHMGGWVRGEELNCIIRTLCGYLALWTEIFDFGRRDGHTKLKGNHRKNNRKKSTCYVKKDDKPSYSGMTYENYEVMMVMSAEALLDWIMDLGCSYDMTPRIRRDNYIYSLDGHAVAGELNASVKEKDSLAHVWNKRLGHISEARLQVLENQGAVWQEKSRLVGFVSGGIIRRQELCIESGIAKHLIVVRTPQQNGLAKPMNKTLMDKVTSTAIEKKTTMEMWSGHPSVKGYRLYRLDDESPKIVTSRDVVFNKSVMYKDTLKDSGADRTDQEDGDDKDARDRETDQIPDLTNYQLVQDREPRTRTKPLRFRDKTNIVGYAFVAVEKEDTHEPLTYQETVACKDSSKWKDAMKEEIDSLRKNKTWELVNHPAGQNLSPRQWYRRFDEYMLSNGFKHSSYDSCVYYKSYAPDNEKSVQMPLCEHFKLSLKDCLVKDYDVERMSKVPYVNAVGSLMYLMVCTRPDIAYEVSVVSRYLANPCQNHWEVVKWILKYMRGIVNMGLVNGTHRGNHMDVTCFVDSEYAKDPDKDAEYMALTEAVKEAIWLKGLLEKLGVELNTVAVNYDNQDAIHLSRNRVFHKRTKHINVRYHFIREVLEAKTIKVLKVSIEHNAMDV